MSASTKSKFDHLREWATLFISLAAFTIALPNFWAIMVPNVEATVKVGFQSVMGNTSWPSPKLRVELDVFNAGNRSVELSSALLYLIPGDYYKIVAGAVPACVIPQGDNVNVLNQPDNSTRPESGFTPEVVDAGKILPYPISVDVFGLDEDVKSKTGMLCVLVIANDALGRQATLPLPVGALMASNGKRPSDIQNNKLSTVHPSYRAAKLVFMQ